MLVTNSLLCWDCQQGDGERALPSIHRNSVSWDCQGNPPGMCQNQDLLPSQTPLPQWAQEPRCQAGQPAVPSPQPWQSGSPWSCRTGTASLRASGHPPGAAFSTDPPAPAREQTQNQSHPPVWAPVRSRTRVGKPRGTLQPESVSQSSLPQGAPPIPPTELPQSQNLCSCLRCRE